MPSYGGVGHRPRAVERYLLGGERCVVASRRHWICIAEPWLSTLGSLLLVAWVTFDIADPRTGRPLDVLWWLWFAVLGRALWMTFDHAHTWFVATDRRLLLLYGIFVRRVAMMPLAKVTDMSYHRTPLGWVLGYGTFVLESAGQEQALHEIDHVPHPDPAYRAIISEIFHKDLDDEEPSDDEDGAYDGAAYNDGPHGTHGPRGPYGPNDEWGGPTRPSPSWDDDDPTHRLALSPDEARRWTDRLRGAGSRSGDAMGPTGRGGAGRDWLRGRRDPFQAPHPDPSVGAHHDVSARGTPRPNRAAKKPADAEWLYRSEPTREHDDRDEPPRDATGYWG